MSEFQDACRLVGLARVYGNGATAHHALDHIDSYDSMWTMIAKLRAGRAGYYIIVPGDATMQVLIAEDIVEKIDVFAMPNFANVDDNWREVYWDPKREYSAPLAWVSTAFAVDTAVVTGDVSSLAVLFDPAEDV